MHGIRWFHTIFANSNLSYFHRRMVSQIQCSQILFGRFRHLGLKNSPKSPTFRPNFAHFSPNLDQIFANFWPPRPFLLLFYVTMSEKNEISPIFSKNSLVKHCLKSWEIMAQKLLIFLHHFWTFHKNHQKCHWKLSEYFEKYCNF